MPTRRKKSNHNNKTKKFNNNNRNKTRKRSQTGGVKKKSTKAKKAKNRWGVPLERKHIIRTVHPEDLDRALSQDPGRIHDISADIRRNDNTYKKTSIKAKIARKKDYKGGPLKGKRSIDNADACRFLHALFHDPDPYELILIEYRSVNGHMSNVRRVSFNLTGLRPYIFRGIDEESFLNSVVESSDLIKSGNVEKGRRIANSLNNMLKQRGSPFRLNPKISSKITSGETTKGQKRLQCGLKFDFTDINILPHVTELSPLTSEDSPRDVGAQAAPAAPAIQQHNHTPRPSSAAHSSIPPQLNIPTAPSLIATFPSSRVADHPSSRVADHPSSRVADHPSSNAARPRRSSNAADRPRRSSNAADRPRRSSNTDDNASTNSNLSQILEE
jgi:hypothetical protein